MMRNSECGDDLKDATGGRWQDEPQGRGRFLGGLGVLVLAALLIAAGAYFAGSHREGWWEWAKGLAGWPLVFAWNFAGLFVGGFVCPLGGGGAEGGNGGMIWVGGLLLNWGLVTWILTRLVGKFFRGGSSPHGEER